MKDDLKISASLQEDITEGHPFREAYKVYKDTNDLPLVSDNKTLTERTIIGKFSFCDLNM